MADNLIQTPRRTFANGSSCVRMVSGLHCCVPSALHCCLLNRNAFNCLLSTLSSLCSPLSPLIAAESRESGSVYECIAVRTHALFTTNTNLCSLTGSAVKDLLKELYRFIQGRVRHELRPGSYYILSSMLTRCLSTCEGNLHQNFGCIYIIMQISLVMHGPIMVSMCRSKLLRRSESTDLSSRALRVHRS